MKALTRPFLAVLALHLLACGPNAVDRSDGGDAGADAGAPNPCDTKPHDDDIVTFAGQLLNADGTPKANVEVGAWTGSLGCFDPLWLFFGADSPDVTATTDSEGRFTMQQTWRQTKSIFYTDLCFTISLRNKEAWGVFQQTGRAQVELYPKQLQNDLPVLKDWDEAATADVSGDPVRLHWNALEATHPYPAAAYDVLVRSDAQTVWSARTTTNELALPRYLLEDFGALVFAPRASASISASCTAFEVGLSGKGASFSSPPPMLPPSRGAACATDRGPIADPCPFTDGKLVASGLGGMGATRLDILLSDAQPLGRVVLRGMSLTTPTEGEAPALEVQASEDGTTFTPVLTGIASDGTGYVDLAFPQPVTAKMVRLQWTNATLTGGVEVSLWP